MILSILIILSGFYWLMLESNFLRVRLPVGNDYAEYDKMILAQIKAEWEAKEQAYQDWIDKRYEPKLRLCLQQDKDTIDRRDKWLAENEDLQARRNGEMIYQRGSHYGH